MQTAVRIFSIALCLTLCAAVCSAQTESRDGSRPEPGTVRVQTAMVSLPVVVTNQNGEYIKDLKSENFRIFEDGEPQEIAGFAAVEEPISVALALDTSGSTESELKRIQDEAIYFISLLKKDDTLAILSFADDVILWESFSLFGKKNPDVIRKMKPGGMSAVYEAVWLALEQVLKHEFGRKALVLFSDGMDNRSQTVTEEETLALARRTETTIYCVYYNTKKKGPKWFPPFKGPMPRPSQPLRSPEGSGWDIDEYAAGREYLMKLSHYSGGILVDAKKIGDLRSAFQKIARDLSSQYSIGYYPGKRDGKYHRVEVRVLKPGLTARTREGYFAPDR